MTTGRTVRVATGVTAPYPEPTTPEASRVGRANRREGTKPELAIRSELHRRGLRFRKDHFVKVEGAKAHIDICFTAARVAVFIDGCFWHRCPLHHTLPKSNQSYWLPKLQANVDRDRRVTDGFEEAGWTVLRIWEHVAVVEAADRVEAVVRSRQARRP